MPGFNRNEHGRLIAAAPWRGGEVTYPASVTIRAWKGGQDFSYRYALAKNDEEAPWQIISATRLDKQGKPVQELPPK